MGSAAVARRGGPRHGGRRPGARGVWGLCSCPRFSCEPKTALKKLLIKRKEKKHKRRKNVLKRNVFCNFPTPRHRKGPSISQASSAQSEPPHLSPSTPRGLPAGALAGSPGGWARGCTQQGHWKRLDSGCKEAQGASSAEHTARPRTSGGPGGQRKSWSGHPLHCEGSGCGTHFYPVPLSGVFAKRTEGIEHPPHRGTKSSRKEPSERPQRLRPHTRQEHAGLRGPAPHLLGPQDPRGL